MSKKYSMKVYPAGRGRDIYRNIEICGDESLDRLYILVREYRCSGGTETASPAEGNR